MSVKGTNIKPVGGKQLQMIPDPAHPPQQLPTNPGGILPYHKNSTANGK